MVDRPRKSPPGDLRSSAPIGEGRAVRAWTPTAIDVRGSAPLRLGEVLVGAQQYVARQTGALMTQDEWRTIVGPKIAARTRIGRLQRETLTIKVASSAWSNELSFLRPQILQKLRHAGHEVNRLRFTVDQDLSLDKRPPARFRPAGAPSASAQKFEVVPLPPELLDRLRQIEDPNLRAAVAEAARSSLGRPPRPGAR